MTVVSESGPGRDADVARFLSRYPPFKGVGHAVLEEIAASGVAQVVPAGDAVLVERGTPGTHLYVVMKGSMELVHRGHVVDVVVTGQVFGHPTLLTGLPPEFTVRAREDTTVLPIPRDVALELLNRPEGMAFVAGALRERLIQAANAIYALPDVRTVPVTSLLRGEPVFCDPGTSIREAARLMTAERVTAILVPNRDGFGIVTDADLRDRVVADGVSPEAPASSIMTTPVKTIRAEMLAPQASIEMMEAGVNHLPVVDARGKVLGVISAGSLMNLDALSPFALRQSLAAARSESELADAAARLPRLVVTLLDAGLEAAALTRVITLLSDSMTVRLLDLAKERYGPAPVPYAWLALGSTARQELTLASDQDNALAYADTDDPGIDAYFRSVATDVNAGLALCGFSLDPSGVLAQDGHWRMSQAQWYRIFADSLAETDWRHVLRASIAFDFRHVAGDLSIAPQLSALMHEAPRHRSFLDSLAQMASQIRSPLGFRQRMTGPIDVKKSALLPIVNLARFYAFGLGISASGTLDRLIAVQETGRYDDELIQSLRDAFATVSHLRLRHHAAAIREGRPPDNAVETANLRPLTRVSLHEALRLIAAAQARLP